MSAQASRLSVLLVSAAFLWPVQALAQDYDISRRGMAGLNLQVGLPQGEFDRFVDAAGGLGGFAVYNIDRAGYFGVRLDGSFLVYGSETFRRPLSTTIQRVQVDVTTSNEIFSLFVGPQLTFRMGAVQPYVNGGAGFSYFATESRVSDHHHVGDIASSVNFDDATFAWMGGGGLAVGLSRKVYLTMSAQYVDNGVVTYLREGGLRETSSGVRLDPITSEANLWVIQVGVGLTFRGWH